MLVNIRRVLWARRGGDEEERGSRMEVWERVGDSGREGETMGENLSEQEKKKVKCEKFEAKPGNVQRM